MNRSFQLYRLLGHTTVHGWLTPEVLDIASILNSVQRTNNVVGAIAEIGIHHGRLFAGLSLLRSAGDYAVAIDVFGDQQYNVDNSGKGDLKAFRRNMLRWASLDRVEILQRDSALLKPSEVLSLARGSVRLFSIDGGHTQPIVSSDMKLAESTISAGGVVIADDVFNESWPGVATGTLDYLNQGGTLVPFAIGFNKVFFSQLEFVDRYRQVLQTSFEGRILFNVKLSEFAGHPVVVVAKTAPTPRRLLSRNKTARKFYHRLKGGDPRGFGRTGTSKHPRTPAGIRANGANIV